MSKPTIDIKLSFGEAGTIWAERLDGTKVLVATLNLKDLTIPQALAYGEAFMDGVSRYWCNP